MRRGNCEATRVDTLQGKISFQDLGDDTMDELGRGLVDVCKRQAGWQRPDQRGLRALVSRRSLSGGGSRETASVVMDGSGLTRAEGKSP